MLDLTVYIKYERKKARLLLDMRQEEVALTIRRDFTSMKLPHPPRSNIKKPTLKGVTASWTTWKNSVGNRLLTYCAREIVEPSNRRTCTVLLPP
jgi:hypothetical protein